VSNFILFIIVAADFSLCFSSSNGCMWIPRKLRNLVVALPFTYQH